MDIKIIEDAQITYQRVCWNVAIEYKDNKYIVLSDEDDNGGDVNSLYEYDSSKPYNIGNEISNMSDLHDEVVETLWESGEMNSGMKKGLIIECEQY
jgi:hypothetical protein